MELVEELYFTGIEKEVQLDANKDKQAEMISIKIVTCLRTLLVNTELAFAM